MPRGRAQDRRRAGTEFSRSSANESGTRSATGSGGLDSAGRPDADSVAARATGSGGLDSARSGRGPDSVAARVEWVPARQSFGRSATWFGRRFRQAGRILRPEIRQVRQHGASSTGAAGCPQVGGERRPRPAVGTGSRPSRSSGSQASSLLPHPSLSSLQHRKATESDLLTGIVAIRNIRVLVHRQLTAAPRKPGRD
jgi:hypothetical protein